MTEKEIQLKKIENLYLSRLQKFAKTNINFISQLANSLNNRISNQAKYNAISDIGVLFSNNNFEYFLDVDFKKKLKEIRKQITYYNEKIITKFLEENDYIKINTEYTYYFIPKQTINEIIKNYNLCQQK